MKEQNLPITFECPFGTCPGAGPGAEYKPSFETIVLSKLTLLEAVPKQLLELDAKVEKLVQDGIRQEAINNDLRTTKEEVKVLQDNYETMKQRSVFVRGGMKTLAVLGTLIVGAVTVLYHLLISFFTMTTHAPKG